jgi:hypothetical protein
MVSQRHIQHLKSFSVLLQLGHVFQANVLNDLGVRLNTKCFGDTEMSFRGRFSSLVILVNTILYEYANKYNSLGEQDFLVRSSLISNTLPTSRFVIFLCTFSQCSWDRCHAGLRAIVSLCPQSLPSMYEKHIQEENVFNISQYRQPPYKLKVQ